LESQENGLETCIFKPGAGYEWATDRYPVFAFFPFPSFLLLATLSCRSFLFREDDDNGLLSMRSRAGAMVEWSGCHYHDVAYESQKSRYIDNSFEPPDAKT
jgi:hypothetical protein